MLKRPNEEDGDKEPGDHAIEGRRQALAEGLRPRGDYGDAHEPRIDAEEERRLTADLKELLNRYILRRVKVNVLNELPHSNEYVVLCPLSGVQTRMYELICAKEGTQNKFVKLKKLINHPYLFFMGAHFGTFMANNLCRPAHIADNDLLISSCGKLFMLDMILSRLFYVGHRVLIFSQMTSMLDILEVGRAHAQVYLNYKNYKYLRLDGSTSSEKRTEKIRLFNEPNSSYFVFILSIKSGSLGINLQTADTVIIYDNDITTNNSAQAQSRVHRIGQKNDVVSLRLVTPHTVEDNAETSLPGPGAGAMSRATGLNLEEPYGQGVHPHNLGEGQNEILSYISTAFNKPSVEKGNCVDSVEALNKVLARSEDDGKVFNLIGYKNFILSPFPLIRQRVIPPFIYRAITANKKFHLTDDERRRLYVDATVWDNILNDYSIYGESLSSKLLANFSNTLKYCGNAQALPHETHVITNLPIHYPVEYLAPIYASDLPKPPVAHDAAHEERKDQGDRGHRADHADHDGLDLGHSDEREAPGSLASSAGTASAHDHNSPHADDRRQEGHDLAVDQDRGLGAGAREPGSGRRAGRAKEEEKEAKGDSPQRGARRSPRGAGKAGARGGKSPTGAARSPKEAAKAAARAGAAAVAGDGDGCAERQPLIDRGVFELLVAPGREADKRALINRCVAEQVGRVIAEKSYIEFNELPHRFYLSDYYERIAEPICLADIAEAARKGEFASLREVKARLERLTNNARTYNGAESFLFAKALALAHHLVEAVTFAVFVGVVALHSEPKSRAAADVLGPYFAGGH